MGCNNNMPPWGNGCGPWPIYNSWFAGCHNNCGCNNGCGCNTGCGCNNSCNTSCGFASCSSNCCAPCGWNNCFKNCCGCNLGTVLALGAVLSCCNHRCC